MRDGAPDFSIGRNAHGAAWDVPIFDDDGNPVDVTAVGAAVVLRYRDASQAAAEVVRTGAVVGAVAPGQARYVFVAGDTAAAGTFLARFEVTIGANVYIYPTRGLLKFVVEPTA